MRTCLASEQCMTTPMPTGPLPRWGLMSDSMNHSSPRPLSSLCLSLPILLRETPRSPRNRTSGLWPNTSCMISLNERSNF